MSTVCVREADEHYPHGDKHATGPVCWLIDDVHELAEPVGCIGRQKLWRLPQGVQNLLSASLRRATSASPHD